MKIEGSASISQRHRSADPDQNVMDPQHCAFAKNIYSCLSYIIFMFFAKIIMRFLHLASDPCFVICGGYSLFFLLIGLSSAREDPPVCGHRYGNQPEVVKEYIVFFCRLIWVLPPVS
jgi:hypothetical protein